MTYFTSKLRNIMLLFAIMPSQSNNDRCFSYFMYFFIVVFIIKFIYSKAL